jgi:hypothetical protein
MSEKVTVLQAPSVDSKQESSSADVTTVSKPVSIPSKKLDEADLMVEFAANNGNDLVSDLAVTVKNVREAREKGVLSDDLIKQFWSV